MQEQIDAFRETEESVLATLEAAKALMNDISASAEKRAEILVKNAELDAELLLKQARESLERLKEEELELGQRVESVRNRFKSMLETELDRFDVLAEELFGTRGSAAFTDVSPSDTQPVRGGPVREDDLFKTVAHVRSKE
jgi:cell division initiation protein